MYYRSMPVAASGPDLKHWKYTKDKDGIVWLYADRAGERVNALNSDMLEELDTAYEAALADKAVGVALMSAKDTGYIHGADIRDFADMTEEAKVAEQLERAHALFDKLAAAPIPLVAGINGVCLGGGLELALTCQYRVALNDPSVRVGLPEVKLGIFPGFGGTARLTQLIGGKDAMPLMLAGKLVRAGAARGLGIVDRLVKPHESLEWAVRDAILKNRKAKGPSLVGKLSNTKPARIALANIMERKTAEKVRPEHYPSPFTMIEQWRDHGGSMEEMLKSEKEAFPRHMVSDTAKGLQRVFHLMERLKGFGKVASAKNLATVRRVHVIGAGTMGADIAAWAAFRGFEVTLQDLQQEVIDKGLASAKKLFRKRIRNKAEAKSAETRLRGDKDGNGIARADLIIEAIVERADIKKSLYADLEEKMKPDAILATNTSSIQLEELSEDLKRPERLVGIHFFNPVALMPLVEVIYTDKTSQDIIDRASAFITKIDKLPLPVKSCPGFLVNRALVPYSAAAYRELEDGQDKPDIDEAAEAFGMPMGPFEMIDMVGLDVAAHVANILMGEVPGPLQSAVDAGELGKKSGKGFYEWVKGKPQKGDVTMEPEALAQLGEDLLQPMIDEARACVRDGIVADADLADAGLIFGAGFAPFRGGPLYYADKRDAKKQTEA